MPRMGLNTAEVVAAAAVLADQAGIDKVSFAALAVRLGVKAPALYKHVDNVGDLLHRVATLAMIELGDALRDALQGKSGEDAIRVLFTVAQAYIKQHPGRYNATTGAQFLGADDPLFAAAARVVESIGAALSSYGIRARDLDHAIRMLRCVIHGYAMFQAANAFQWINHPDESIAWMIRFFNTGLSGIGSDDP